MFVQETKIQRDIRHQLTQQTPTDAGSGNNLIGLYKTQYETIYVRWTLLYYLSLQKSC